MSAGSAMRSVQRCLSDCSQVDYRIVGMQQSVSAVELLQFIHRPAAISRTDGSERVVIQRTAHRERERPVPAVTAHYPYTLTQWVEHQASRRRIRWKEITLI